MLTNATTNTNWSVLMRTRDATNTNWSVLMRTNTEQGVL
jgi:hypothetical protein